MSLPELGVLGARSPVGEAVLEIFADQARSVYAFSRNLSVVEKFPCEALWQAPGAVGLVIPLWICAAPIWALPDYFDWLLACGVRRVVVLSSTSCFAKHDSPDFAERLIAERLLSAEARLQAWASQHGVEWLVLRPTLIYGSGRDRNVAEIMRFVRRWRFFPLAGAASGLRQPVHVRDVAAACVAALNARLTDRAYNISGAEVLSFREMVLRTAAAADVRPRLLFIPVGVLRWGMRLMALVRPAKGWGPGMADRMNRDQNFDHTDAARDLGFSPRAFRPEAGRD